MPGQNLGVGLLTPPEIPDHVPLRSPLALPPAVRTREWPDTLGAQARAKSFKPLFRPPCLSHTNLREATLVIVAGPGASTSSLLARGNSFLKILTHPQTLLLPLPPSCLGKKTIELYLKSERVGGPRSGKKEAGPISPPHPTPFYGAPSKEKGGAEA